ncbi:hypothetical protein D9R06_09985 [Kocuria marina subsp. indica]|nr:hypothetical protein D9R06_09985 [Kocuria indica]
MLATVTAFLRCSLAVYTFGMTETPPDSAAKNTPIPEALRTAGAVQRRGSRYNMTRVLPVDVELMRFLLKMKYARPIQIAGWLGASGSYVYTRLRSLQAWGLVEKDVYSAGLRSWPPVGGQRVEGRAVTVWRVTTKGRNRLDPWPVAGEPASVPVKVKASKMSKSLGDHTLGAVDLAVLYRRWGFEVATEREYTALEMPQRVPPVVSSFVWCPHVAGRGHAPDLGVIHPDDGSKWGIELERATKRDTEYRDVMNLYVDHGLGQVWHSGSPATASNLTRAAASIGHPLRRVEVNGQTVFMSEDGMIRLVGWWPGFSDPEARKEWPDVWPALDYGVPPGGFTVAGGRPDLSVSWKMV